MRLVDQCQFFHLTFIVQEGTNPSATLRGWSVANTRTPQIPYVQSQINIFIMINNNIIMIEEMWVYNIINDFSTIIWLLSLAKCILYPSGYFLIVKNQEKVKEITKKPGKSKRLPF